MDLADNPQETQTKLYRYHSIVTTLFDHVDNIILLILLISQILSCATLEFIYTKIPIIIIFCWDEFKEKLSSIELFSHARRLPK